MCILIVTQVTPSSRLESIEIESRKTYNKGSKSKFNSNALLIFFINPIVCGCSVQCATRQRCLLQILGLKLSTPRFFWVGKFCKYCFCVALLSRDFLGYSKQSEDSWHCPGGSARLSRPHSSASKVQSFLEIWHGIFGGLIFGPGIFLGF